MSTDDPYAPPKAALSDLEEWTRSEELAGRFTRFAAAFVDSILGMLFAFPMIYVLGTWDYVSRGQNPPVMLTVAGTALGFAWFILIHGYFLKTNGQTIGKKLTGIRIANLDGRVPDLTTLLLLRYLPISLVTLIPMIGVYLPLIDVLFIFRSDRRCIHDLIAGTKVVLAGRGK
jgi:uncharacterized RDD family membrane protein YckC